MKRICWALALIGLIAVGCEKSESSGQDSPAPEAKSKAVEQEKVAEDPEPEEPTYTEEELAWIPAQPDDMEPLPITHVPTSGQAARGASEAEALVTIVEIGDYGCPDTRDRRDLVESLLDEYGDDVRYVYRNVVWVPGEFGPFAANLASAAAQHDQYWKAYDIIWKRFRKLDEYSKESYLEPLGLGLKELEAAKKFAKQRTDENQKLAKELGVQWVPTFFVNGVPMVKVGDEDFEKFVQIQIEKARSQSDESPELDGKELYQAMVELNSEAAKTGE